MNLLVQAEWDNRDADEYVHQLGGSKSGVHAYIEAQCPALRKNLPGPWRYYLPHENLETFLNSLNCGSKVAVRGCHKQDMAGMVDVLDTEFAQGRNDIRETILRIIEAAKSPEVKKYVEYESGEEFDGNIGVLVQPYQGRDCFSIMEHPHYRGLYSIVGSIFFQRVEDLFDEEGYEIDIHTLRLDLRNNIYELIKNPLELRKFRIGDVQTLHRDIAARIIRLYRDVSDTGVIPSTPEFRKNT